MTACAAWQTLSPPLPPPPPPPPRATGGSGANECRVYDRAAMLKGASAVPAPSGRAAAAPPKVSLVAAVAGLARAVYSLDWDGDSSFAIGGGDMPIRVFDLVSGSGGEAAPPSSSPWLLQPPTSLPPAPCAGDSSGGTSSSLSGAASFASAGSGGGGGAVPVRVWKGGGGSRLTALSTRHTYPPAHW